MYEPWGREQVLSPAFSSRELHVAEAIEQFRKKGESLHVENEKKINSAISHLSVPLRSRTIGPYI